MEKSKIYVVAGKPVEYIWPQSGLNIHMSFKYMIHDEIGKVGSIPSTMPEEEPP